ncbi:MAG: hypothetical protein IBJ15_10185 [Alphaproteobacteria bacterium]|nr:hypothetical protein [Alphaproteobacteria bacterium]
MMIRARFLLLAAFAGALAACTERLPPGGVATLDGIYEGDVTRSSGPVYSCPNSFKLRGQVASGEARGEIFDSQQPDLVVDRILAFIEADGRVITAFRSGGDSYGIDGRFGASTFTALANGRACSYSAFARKRQ